MILHELLSFELLRIIWWALLGVLLIGFAVTDGFDMGVAVLLPFIAKNDVERRVVINTVGPVWEGNQVWLILGGGAIFAAWPPLYAVSFSGFYLAMFLALAALILRPVAFKYRSKKEDPAWRTRWDWALFVSGFVPALIFGVAVGNVLLGVPFRLTDDLYPMYEGSLFGLLNPFALLVGITSVAMMVMHGSAWICVKAEGEVANRARDLGSVATKVVLALYIIIGAILALFVKGYAFTEETVTNGPSNPLFSDVVHSGTWFSAYAERPWILIAPLIAIVCALLTLRGLKRGGEISTLITSKLTIVGLIASVGLTMFPFILPSSIDPRSSLTVWDSSSSQQTLFVMLVSTVLFLPIVLMYTAWVYKVLWGKVTVEDINTHGENLY